MSLHARNYLLYVAIITLAAMGYIHTVDLARARSHNTVVLTGKLLRLHSDNFQTWRAKDAYFLDQGNGRPIELRLNKAQSDLRPGSHVRVAGTRQGSVLKASSTEVLRAPATVASTGTSRKVAVVLFNFKNSRQQPWTPDRVREAVFTGSKSVNAFFKENSFGQLDLAGHERFDGDVLGWYTIPYLRRPCQFKQWGWSAWERAKQAGYDIRNYDSVMYIWPKTASCRWSGQALVWGNLSYINGDLNWNLLGHELGHNLGLLHAQSYRCVDGRKRVVSISEHCVAREYGDPFDVMGSGDTHNQNYNKEWLGFIPERNVLKVTESGTYKLLPSEQLLPGAQVIKIKRLTVLGAHYCEFLHLNFRQPYGNFSGISSDDPVANGVSIRITRHPNGNVEPRLLDMTPKTPGFSDATLAAGRTFTDQQSSVSVTVQAISTLGATVQIDFTDDAPEDINCIDQ